MGRKRKRKRSYTELSEREQERFEALAAPMMSSAMFAEGCRKFREGDKCLGAVILMGAIQQGTGLSPLEFFQDVAKEAKKELGEDDAQKSNFRPCDISYPQGGGEDPE